MTQINVSKALLVNIYLFWIIHPIYFLIFLSFLMCMSEIVYYISFFLICLTLGKLGQIYLPLIYSLHQELQSTKSFTKYQPPLSLYFENPIVNDNEIEKKRSKKEKKQKNKLISKEN